MTDTLKGYTEAKLAGDPSYVKSKLCMLCGGAEYWVRGHRCAECNPKPTGEIRKAYDEIAAKDNYYKDGAAIAGRYIPEQKAPWPMMQFEDAETSDHQGRYCANYSSALRGASSAADMAEG